MSYLTKLEKVYLIYIDRYVQAVTFRYKTQISGNAEKNIRKIAKTYRFISAYSHINDKS